MNKASFDRPHRIEKNSSIYAMARPSFIYINGYPGVGKLTVARILRFAAAMGDLSGLF
jgi:2-phosphoglycerate kinase